MNVNINIPQLKDICSMCFGAGKLKTMRMAMTYDAGPVRSKDTEVKCNHCNGTGYKKE